MIRPSLLVFACAAILSCDQKEPEGAKFTPSEEYGGAVFDPKPLIGTWKIVSAGGNTSKVGMMVEYTADRQILNFSATGEPLGSPSSRSFWHLALHQSGQWLLISERFHVEEDSSREIWEDGAVPMAVSFHENTMEWRPMIREGVAASKPAADPAFIFERVENPE